jgi:hypothetical protein
MDSPVIPGIIGDRLQVSGSRGSPPTKGHCKNNTKMVPLAGPAVRS